MAERDPIELIREQITQADGVAGLRADHELFVSWHAETKTILEKIFSPKSIHCQSFLALRFREVSAKGFASPEIDKINAARYKRDLESAKNILQGAVKELMLDRTLFKKMQTTPKTVEVSLKGEYFVSSGIMDPDILRAIENAFEGTGLQPTGRREERISLALRIEQIKHARFGIYSAGGGPEREETLLELGAALALGKEVILLCGRGASLPVDLLQVERVEYENPAQLSERLKKRIR